MAINRAKRRRIWAWIGAGVALACAVINGTILWHTTSRRQQIEQLQQELASIQRDVDQVEAEAQELLGEMRRLDQSALDDAKRQRLKQELGAIEKRLAELSGRFRRAEQAAPSLSN